MILSKHCLFAISLFSIINTYSYTQEINSSKIDVNISIKKSIVENIINSQLPYTIEDSGSGNQIFNGNNNNILSVGLDILGAVDKKFSQFSESFIWAYKINRTPIIFVAEGQDVQATTDFNGFFKASWSRQNQGTEINLNGNAGIKSIVSISQDWNLQANSTPFLNISNNNLPLTLNIYGLKLKTDINISDSLERSIGDKLKTATNELDSKINSFNLKGLVETYWQKFKEPILINEDYDLWLTVNPISARYSDLVTTETDLGIKVGTDVNLHLYVGDKPGPINLGTLPYMNYGFVDNTFSVVLPVSSSYKNLTEIINKNVPELNFDVFSGVSSNLKNIEISGQDGTLFANSDLTLSILNFLHPTGVIKASLKPSFNAETGEITGQDFDYTLETDSFILKIVNSLFKNKIKNLVEKDYLSFNTSNEINLAKLYIQNKVKDIELDKNVHLKSEIDSLKITNLDIGNEFISLTVNTTGNSVLEILSQ